MVRTMNINMNIGDTMDHRITINCCHYSIFTWLTKRLCLLCSLKWTTHKSSRHIRVWQGSTTKTAQLETSYVPEELIPSENLNPHTIIVTLALCVVGTTPWRWPRSLPILLQPAEHPLDSCFELDLAATTVNNMINQQNTTGLNQL